MSEPGEMDLLLRDVCRLTDAELANEELMSPLRSAAELVFADRKAAPAASLEHAAALLASALGSLSRLTPSPLPRECGVSADSVCGWIDRERLELLIKQLAGFRDDRQGVEMVASIAAFTVSRAISLGLLESCRYDAWVPGMPSGTGLREAVAATAYGVARALRLAGGLRTPPPPPPWASTAARALPTTTVASGAPAVRPSAVEPQPNIQLITPLPPIARQLIAGSEGQAAADRYAFARQVDLVRATGQVLGDGELNAGVLSRACKEGQIATNNLPGRANLVSVKSFLVWLGNRHSLQKDELDQVRNAIIGEIGQRD